MEGVSDSSDSDDHEYDNNQNVIIIPITKRIDPTPAEACRSENGVTMINFAKSKQLVCEKCSVTLRDMHSSLFVKLAFCIWEVFFGRIMLSSLLFT